MVGKAEYSAAVGSSRQAHVRAPACKNSRTRVRGESVELSRAVGNFVDGSSVAEPSVKCFYFKAVITK